MISKSQILRRCILTTSILTASVAPSLFAQNPVFTPGNLLLSHSIYSAPANAVPFPGLLANNAASVSDASFPAVFNNETPDASFGITSTILLDQLSPTNGALIGNSLDVTNLIATQLGQNFTTSFPSKSELGLSFTPDGTGVTFMGYGAAANSIDVSNANTPGHVDITNPVNGGGILIAQRNIAELSYNGVVQMTNTNGYSGNNGRNAFLGANGNYYTVGNAGNNGKSVTYGAGTVGFSTSSTTVTLAGSSKTANIYVGAPFTGTAIPVGAYVTAITSATQFTISATPTGTPSGSYIANAGAVQLTGVSFTAGNANITVADTSKLVPGMPLTGTGFPANSYISSITDAMHFVASANPTVNSGSGSYTAAVSNSMLSDNTGVRMIQKGLNDTIGTGTGILDAVNNSTVVGRVNGTYGITPGYQRGFTVTQIGAAADKSGKDDNFRGITNYKNTAYCSKGSGGNGFDAVYQINPSGGAYVPPGTSAGLPTAANAGTASINPLPGWPTTSTGANEGLSNGSTVYHPFGIWFANDTTLYVADEGLAGTSGSNAGVGGLQKWSWNPGTSQWQLLYTLPTANIPQYTVSGNVNGVAGSVGPLASEGLRNIAGKDNGDGTVTIFGITSTAAGTGGATLNDEGADPNLLVSVTDTVTATTNPGTPFAVLRTAAYGEVLRGVAFVPGRVSVAPGGFTLNRRTNKLSQTVTVTNDTGATVTGPVQLVLGGLSNNTTLANSTGNTANNYPVGAAYITATSGNMAPGAAVNVVLQFTPPASGTVTYTPSTVTGTTAP